MVLFFPAWVAVAAVVVSVFVPSVATGVDAFGVSVGGTEGHRFLVPVLKVGGLVPIFCFPQMTGTRGLVG